MVVQRKRASGLLPKSQETRAAASVRSGCAHLNPKAVEELLTSLQLPVGRRIDPASRGGGSALSIVAAAAHVSVEDAANYGTGTLELMFYLGRAKRISALPFVTHRWSRAKGQQSLRDIERAIKVIEANMGVIRPAVVALRSEFLELQRDWKATAELGRWSQSLRNDLVALPLLDFFEIRFRDHRRKRSPYLRKCLVFLGVETPKSEALESYRLRDVLKRYDARKLRSESGSRF